MQTIKVFSLKKVLRIYLLKVVIILISNVHMSYCGFNLFYKYMVKSLKKSSGSMFIVLN